MTASPRGRQAETSFSLGLFRAVRYYLRSRRGWLALGGIAVAAGLAFNWGWLVTAGVAPILISVLPCVAMCAVGVCCMKKTASQSSADPAINKEPSELPTGKDD